MATWAGLTEGGRENLEAVTFLQQATPCCSFSTFPGALRIAEESTTWPMVTSPPTLGAWD